MIPRWSRKLLVSLDRTIGNFVTPYRLSQASKQLKYAIRQDVLKDCQELSLSRKDLIAEKTFADSLIRPVAPPTQVFDAKKRRKRLMSLLLATVISLFVGVIYLYRAMRSRDARSQISMSSDDLLRYFIIQELRNDGLISLDEDITTNPPLPFDDLFPLEEDDSAFRRFLRPFETISLLLPFIHAPSVKNASSDVAVDDLTHLPDLLKAIRHRQEEPDAPLAFAPASSIIATYSHLGLRAKLNYNLAHIQPYFELLCRYHANFSSRSYYGKVQEDLRQLDAELRRLQSINEAWLAKDYLATIVARERAGKGGNSASTIKNKLL
jgi:hypothetical protein